VINTRPPISFYNDNNPDWLNVMIFYHVLGHIDFFQNNLYFRHTWDYDFTGEALSDKRLIAKLRSEKGRQVDYVIEFARSIDNLVDFHGELSDIFTPSNVCSSVRLNFFFDLFLQTEKKVPVSEYIREIERYNGFIRQYGEQGEKNFIHDAEQRFPELESHFLRYESATHKKSRDLLRYLMDHSEFLNRDENLWMKSVMEIIRKTAIFFQPQIRTKIMNEGWASHWHEALFLQDDRICGHEVDFARVHAGVTSMPRVGLNPYALGMRIFNHLEEQADKGRISFEYQRLLDTAARKSFDNLSAQGRDSIFSVRENLCDYMFLKQFIDQDFMDKHRLFVAGRRLDRQRMVWQYYVKSRRAEEYRQMMLDSLYHPPVITVDTQNGIEGSLYLVHHFEGKQLIQEYIANTLMGISYLWGGPVMLESSVGVIASKGAPFSAALPEEEEQGEISWQRVVYSMNDKVFTRKNK